MKLGSLIHPRFTNAFDKLMKLQGVPGRSAFKLRTIAKTIMEELSKYHDAKKAYINEYSEKDAEGKPTTQVLNGQEVLKFPAGKQEEYLKKIVELNDVFIELPTVSWSELGESVTLTPEELFYLEFIVE